MAWSQTQMLARWLVIHSLAHSYPPSVTLDAVHDRRIMLAVNAERKGHPWWLVALIVQHAQVCSTVLTGGVRHG
jgi:hypothetical protein